MLSRSRLSLKMNNIRYCHKWSSKSVRKQFLDYFIDRNDHKFIRSSPVVPFCDPTVAFVNAGMNQFKGIFLNKQNSTYPKVANSQKCVRVGGKHNDLSVVGTDGHHHTFFEMLGNWSFGDYFKNEACTLAWNLLTGPYKINPSALYITYFGGDKNLNLEPDLECKEIWRSLGVPESRIIPFGVKDNFWEMGSSGPCGPCTEIHIDHTYSNALRSNDVNKDLPDLTELWNIVFIQYNRNIDSSIHLLPKRHIDTGMGFERLTAVLQNKKSNYDTDIFTSLFQVIEKNCKGIPSYSGNFNNELDTAYRILADHSRTVIVCIADGMIPEQNQKLRRILRKALYLSETTFKNENLLKDLTLQISDNLGDTYPEIIRNIKQIHDIIDFEKKVYKSVRNLASKSWANMINTNQKLENLDVIEMPGLISAYKELELLQPTKMTSELSFRLFDTHGLDEETITKLSQALNLPFSAQQLHNELENARKRTKNQFINNNFISTVSELLKIPNKINNNIYNYKKIEQNYHFQELDVSIVNIILGNKFVTETILNNECFLILNETNFYTESGGQISDKGIIKFKNKIFNIMDVFNINGHILHRGILETDSLKVGDNGTLVLNKRRRMKIMANHTAVHLLNTAIKKVVNVATCQKSSAVYPDYLNFEVGIYGNKLTMENIENIENMINNIVRKNINVETKVVDSQGLLSLDNVTLIPGEIYPEEKIRIVNINDTDLYFSSCEPCCGTHVLNTGDINDFCITNYKSLGRSTGVLTAVTRDKATLAHKNGKLLSRKIENLLQIKFNTATEIKIIEAHISEMKNEILKNSSDNLLPIYVKTNCLNILNDVTKKIRGTERGIFKDLIHLEMKKVVSLNRSKSKNDNSFIVHFLECSSKLENIQLQQATKICPEVPVVIISYSENLVKARCCVPKKSVNKTFNAQIWMSQTIGNIFKSSCSPPKGQESALICNMKQKKVNLEDWEKLLSQAINSAEKYAYENL